MYISEKDLDLLIRLEDKLGEMENWSEDISDLWELNEKLINQNNKVKKFILKKKKSNQEKRVEKLNKLKKIIIRRILGIILIVGTILACASGIFYDEAIKSNDCTFALLIIPLGLILFMSSKEDNSID